MKTKQLVLPIFLLLVLVQLYVPAKMIWDREDILETGTEYKFRTAPIDPNDPFRGKYIRLSYQDNWVELADDVDWQRGETAYVLLAEDEQGFAKIASIAKREPAGKEGFLKAQVSAVSGDQPKRLVVAFPFDRFYMKETKALAAEQAYFEAQLDTGTVTYSLVNIKKGEAVLKDVLIDGTSINHLIRGNY
ncbi:hypothetical protein GCM10028791_36480 [Echinicola sediminis]